MRIQHLLLPATDVPSSLAFFSQQLQLPITGSAIQIGWSTIELSSAAPLAAGSIHLAFNVPFERFDQALAWLRARLPLQQDAAGSDCFALDPPWDSRSVYFDGPEGAVLELIGRRGLASPRRTGPFHGSELTCLSEVGLPTDDVASVVSQAGRLGLMPFVRPSDQFAPLGDDEGLLIVIDRARRWFPEQRRLPGARGLRLTVAGLPSGVTGVVADADQGWDVRIQAP